MGRISATFKRLRWEKEAALVPSLIVGYPSLDVTRQLVPLMARQGADLIELRVPFIDPLAGDAAMQRASHAALQNGVSLADCLGVAADSRRANEIPLVLTSYYKPLDTYGLGRIADDCAAAGVDGLIVPDLPLEEADDLKAACISAGVDLIFMIAPDSTDEHIRRVTEMATGFIYYIFTTDISGARPHLDQEHNELVTRIRQHTSLPLVISSGVNTPEQVAQVTQQADGALVGSALLNLIESLPEEEVLYSVGEFIREMKAATNRKGQE
jgi:tryptophan synthase alpha chain